MKRITYIIIILLSILATSCQDKITLDLEDPDAVLVVDGYLSDIDTTQWIKLSDLENYFADGSPDFTIHKDAVIKLIENNTTIGTYNFNANSNQFEINTKGDSGKFYQIDITLSDGSHYLSAEEEMLAVPTLDSVIIITEDEPTGPGTEETYYTFDIFTDEPEGVGDTYQWKTYINDQYQFEARDLSFADDRFVDGQYVHDYSVYDISAEDLEEKNSDNPNNPIFVTIEQSKISNRYYDFLTLVFQQTILVGGPFASPPAEIRGNVYKLGEDTETLALGYFYTSSISAQTVEVVE